MYSGVIIKHEDRCLLCKRSEKYTHPNQWFIPAGQIETGESPRECAIRELYEETNLEFTESDLHFVGTIPTMDDEGGLTNDFIYLFICEIDHQMIPDLENAQDGKEHTKQVLVQKSKMVLISYSMNILSWRTLVPKKSTLNIWKLFFQTAKSRTLFITLVQISSQSSKIHQVQE